MPSPAVAITERSFSRYPQLRAFLDSNPPDVDLLNDDSYKSIYKLQPTDKFQKNFSLLQILSLYGKSSHIDALGLTDIQTKAAVKAWDYGAIRIVALKGQLHALKYLETHLSEQEQKAAVKADGYLAIQNAARNSQLDTVYHFLQHTNALNYTEKHDHEYGRQFTYSFVDNSINELKAEKETFEAETPTGVYNLDEPKAQQCFYLLRNLIRRGAAVRDLLPERREDDILFLLSIPAVRALCHRAVTVDVDSPGEENELLKLAINTRNEAASAILMQLPEVRRLAEQHNFYRDNTRGDMDLRRMAQDRESSMVALSQSEQQLLEKVSSHYKPMIDAKEGVDGVILEFKAWLETQYNTNPATIMQECIEERASRAFHEHDLTTQCFALADRYWLK